MLHEVWQLERFQSAKVTFKSYNGIRNGAIRLATYDVLLVFHYNYVSILCDIKSKSGDIVSWLSTVASGH